MTITPGARYLSELIGTAVLVLLGCGSAVLAGGSIGLVGISLSFGLALLLLVYAIGPVSGCHVNPAVTLCLAFSGRFPRCHVAPYIVAQLVGATLGGFILYSIASGKTGFSLANGFALNGFGAHSPEGYDLVACLITEIVMTTLLLFVVLSTTKSYFANGFAGVAVGLTLAVIHLVSIPVTNTSVNLARSFGVAVVHGGWAIHQLWLFAVAQITAVLLAVVLHKATAPSNE